MTAINVIIEASEVASVLREQRRYLEKTRLQIHDYKFGY